MPGQVDILLQTSEEPGPTVYLPGTSCNSSDRGRDDGAHFFCLQQWPSSREIGKDFGKRAAAVNKRKRVVPLCRSQPKGSPPACLALGRARAVWSNAAQRGGPCTTALMSTWWQGLTQILSLQVTLLFSNTSRMFSKTTCYWLCSSLTLGLFTQ